MATDVQNSNKTVANSVLAFSYTRTLEKSGPKNVLYAILRLIVHLYAIESFCLLGRPYVRRPAGRVGRSDRAAGEKTISFFVVSLASCCFYQS